jgi:hypothetical protein
MRLILLVSVMLSPTLKDADEYKVCASKGEHNFAPLAVMLKLNRQGRKEIGCQEKPG